MPTKANDISTLTCEIRLIGNQRASRGRAGRNGTGATPTPPLRDPRGPEIQPWPCSYGGASEIFNNWDRVSGRNTGEASNGSGERRGAGRNIGNPELGSGVVR